MPMRCGAPRSTPRMRICTQGDVHQTYLPLFHTNALAYSMLATLWVGATCVIQPRFSASRFWSVALEHSCTWTSTIPFCMKALLEHEILKQHKFRLWGTAVSRAAAVRRLRHQDDRLVGHDRNHHPRHRRRGRPAQHADVDRPRRTPNIRSASSTTTARRPASAAPAIF